MEIRWLREDFVALCKGNKCVRISVTGARLLELLSMQQKFLTFEEMMDYCYPDPDNAPDTKVLDMAFWRLRKTFKLLGSKIEFENRGGRTNFKGGPARLIKLNGETVILKFGMEEGRKILPCVRTGKVYENFKPKETEDEISTNDRSSGSSPHPDGLPLGM